jgi:hypothetical protein
MSTIPLIPLSTSRIHHVNGFGPKNCGKDIFGGKHIMVTLSMGVVPSLPKEYLKVRIALGSTHSGYLIILISLLLFTFKFDQGLSYKMSPGMMVLVSAFFICGAFTAKALLK